MVYERILKYIKTVEGKRIEEKTLREIAHGIDYTEYCELIIKLTKANLIKPIISSGPNGMSPTLYKRYQALKEEISYDSLINEIKHLNHNFNIEGYIINPSRYNKHREYIIVLDNFLKVNKDILETQVSINERSFQIFHKEKALKEDKDLLSILNLNSNLKEALNYYYTPEPFFTYEVNVKNNDTSLINILIIENKDTWYTLRKILMPTCNNLFGIDFNLIIYGEGKKIIRSTNSLTDFNEATLPNRKSKYYYFGDLDYEGIDIFKNLRDNNKTLNIQLMVPLYVKMIQLSSGIDLPVTKELQQPKDLNEFLNYFDEVDSNKIQRILNNRRYIPQEIISFIDFSELIKERVNSNV